jgi:protocadherin alpha
MFVHQLGGIIEPNDGECHLDEDGIYTHSTLQDYPSVMQLSNKVQNNSINIIFAVTENQEDAYSALMKIIEGSKVGVLTADSSNILELVEEQFKVYSGSGFAHYDLLWIPSPIQVLSSFNCRCFLYTVS